MNTLRHIAFLLLASFYLATSCAITVSVVIGGIPSSGAKTIVAHNGRSKEIPPKFMIQRRHLSLAKVIPCPSVHIAETEFPTNSDVEPIVLRPLAVKHTNAYDYASFCDRAPPVA
jgi:hypothetical protein